MTILQRHSQVVEALSSAITLAAAAQARLKPFGSAAGLETPCSAAVLQHHAPSPSEFTTANQL